MRATDQPDWRKVAQVFTRPVFTCVARTGSASSIRLALAEAKFDGAHGEELVSLLENSLRGLRANYACEYTYKAAIADRIIFGRHSPRTASLHVELPVERSIVDVAVFNGTSTAYEIKTELDTDRRLSTQSIDYLKAFDRVYLVTHPSLVDRYERVLDGRVGILAMSPRGSLSQVRVANSCLSRLRKASLFRLLRTDEYSRAVESVFGKQPALSNGQRFQHYSRLWDQLPIDSAHQLVVKAMRDRTTDFASASFLKSLPPSLRVLGYAAPLSSVQRTRLLNAFN